MREPVFRRIIHFNLIQAQESAFRIRKRGHPDGSRRDFRRGVNVERRAKRSIFFAPLEELSAEY